MNKFANAKNCFALLTATTRGLLRQTLTYRLCAHIGCCRVSKFGNHFMAMKFGPLVGSNRIAIAHTCMHDDCFLELTAFNYRIKSHNKIASPREYRAASDVRLLRVFHLRKPLQALRTRCSEKNAFCSLSLQSRPAAQCKHSVFSFTPRNSNFKISFSNKTFRYLLFEFAFFSEIFLFYCLFNFFFLLHSRLFFTARSLSGLEYFWYFFIAVEIKSFPWEASEREQRLIVKSMDSLLPCIATAFTSTKTVFLSLAGELSLGAFESFSESRHAAHF